MMRLIFFLLFLGCYGSMVAANNPDIDSLYKIAVNLSEQELDSMKILAEHIRDDYTSNPNAIVYFNRVMGIYFDTKMNEDSALYFFMKGLESADKVQNSDVLSALYIDIALLYSREKAYDNAKAYYMKAIALCKQIQNQKRLATAYSNLGVVLRKQKHYHEALTYYQLALAINRVMHNTKSEANTLNNMGALLLEEEKYTEAKQYFSESIALRIQNHDSRSLLFEAYTNLAGIAVRTHQQHDFHRYLDSITNLANEFPDPTRALAIRKLMSGYYEEIGDWKHAFESFRIQRMMEDSIVNVEAANTLTEMMEKYHAAKREKENLQLNSKLEQQTLRSRNWLFASLGLGGFLALSFIILWQRNRKNSLLELKNKEIEKQNHRLSELNQEKNALLGVVSHDLSAPFASIRLWNTVLADNPDHNDETKKAIQRIQQATDSGERMIKNMLDVERAFSKEEHRMELEPLFVYPLIQKVVQQFEKQLEEKQLQVVAIGNNQLTLLSDRNYLLRIFQNLFSNAIKYSYPGKTMYWSLHQENTQIHFELRDEGVGIAASELPFLFTKYKNLGSTPTGNESSYGLGLNITKRLLDELGAEIKVSSVLQQGTRIHIYFPA